MNERELGIYMLLCLPTNARYVGKTLRSGFWGRWQNHRSQLRSKTNLHSNDALQFAWNKYGEEAFTLIVIETLPEIPARWHRMKLLDREWYWIAKFCAQGLQVYNRPPSRFIWRYLKEVYPEDIDFDLYPD